MNRIITIALLILSACSQAPTVPTPLPSPEVSESPKGKPKWPEYFDFTLDRVNGPLKMPASGKLVLESHLVSQEDGLASFPKSSVDKIDAHLKKSCEKLNSAGLVKGDCTKVYSNRYVKQWTPSESGAIGQGSIQAKPPLECEMWTVNQYWRAKSRPQPGTRYMIEANGKRVIACAGYETGPGSTAFIGGAQGEVFWALGITNQSTVKMGLINDQSLPFGPLDCE